MQKYLSFRAFRQSFRLFHDANLKLNYFPNAINLLLSFDGVNGAPRNSYGRFLDDIIFKTVPGGVNIVKFILLDWRLNILH